MLSVLLRSTDSYYPFDIFKLFLLRRAYIIYKNKTIFNGGLIFADG